MDTHVASAQTKPKARRRRRKNKSGLKTDGEKQTISENVTTKSKMETSGKSSRSGGQIKGNNTVSKIDNKKQTILKNVPTTKILRPSEIRYSQSSIACKFSDETNIGTLLDDLWSGRCFVSALPMIKVSLINNNWVSADNRRLWVFKQLEVLTRIDTITVKVVKKIYIGKLTSENDGLTVDIRGVPSGSVYTALNQIFPDQYPLHSKRNRRRKRKSKPKKNENEADKIDPEVSLDEAPTECQQEPEPVDVDNNNIASFLVFDHGSDDYSSECEYSDFEYSGENSDEDIINPEYTSSDDDDAADTSDTDESISPTASITDDGATLSKNFSNLQLYPPNNNRPYSTGGDNLNAAIGLRQTLSKASDLDSTKVPFPQRSSERATFQQQATTAYSESGRLSYGQSASATRSNASSYRNIENTTVAKESSAKHGIPTASPLWTGSRNNTSSYSHLEKSIDDLEKSIDDLKKNTAQRRALFQGFISNTERLSRENSQNLVSKPVTRDNTQMKPHARRYPSGGVSYERESYFEDNTNSDRYSISGGYGGNLGGVSDRLGQQHGSNRVVSNRFDGYGARSDVNARKKTQLTDDYIVIEAPTKESIMAQFCVICDRQKHECWCPPHVRPVARAVARPVAVTTATSNNSAPRSPEFIDTVLEGISYVGDFFKKIFTS